MPDTLRARKALRVGRRKNGVFSGPVDWPGDRRRPELQAARKTNFARLHASLVGPAWRGCSPLFGYQREGVGRVGLSPDSHYGASLTGPNLRYVKFPRLIYMRTIHKFSTSLTSSIGKWNMYVSERPKKCSQQSFLKVMEEHFLQRSKSLSKKTQCLPPSWLLLPFSWATPVSSLLATLIIKNALIQLSNEACGWSVQSRSTHQ